MRWILIDLVLALLALAVLALLALRVWRQVKALSRTVSAAGETVGRATEALEVAQGAGPVGARTARPGDPGRSPSASR